MFVLKVELSVRPFPAVDGDASFKITITIDELEFAREPTLDDAVHHALYVISDLKLPLVPCSLEIDDEGDAGVWSVRTEGGRHLATHGLPWRAIEAKA